MVYLLHKYFGRDGREEGEALLERRSGQQDNPRILQAFNEQTPDWLSFFMFTYFTDRDGKFQLCALAESSFDPLARTTKFMLTEEAHHMFVGESGVSRVISRTCAGDERAEDRRPGQAARRRRDRPADHPALPELPLQRDHRPVRRRRVSNAATFYSTGLKGRYEEGKRNDDHQLRGQTYRVLKVQNGQLVEKEVPMLNALNEVLRDDYIKDSIGGVERWNKVIEKAGIPFRLKAPHKAFHRNIGALAGVKVSPDGPGGQRAEWGQRRGQWLPSADRPRLRRQPDGPRGRAGQVRQLDRAAGDGHQPPAGRLRVRPVQLRPTPEAPAALPPQGGDASGPAKPVPRPRSPARRRSGPSGPSHKETPHGHGRHRHQAAPDRPRDLHPLQHLRGHLPGGRDHARLAQLRGRREPSATCAWPASRPAPPAASTTGAGAARARPTAWTSSWLGRAAGRAERRAAAGRWPATRRCGADGAEAQAGRRAGGHPAPRPAFNSAAYGATLPPWSAAHAYTNLYGPRRRRRASPPR
jgi:hypothetical protein